MSVAARSLRVQPETEPQAPTADTPTTMRAATGDLLTIVSVRFRNDALLRKNLELTRAFNPGQSNRWIVVDNEFDGAMEPAGANVDVIPGAARPKARDLGSLHHALGLEKALSAVGTRFVLLLDPDFYVVSKGWIADVVAHAVENKLAFFGAPWHPRWFYQYRDFPAVHFMLIDLEQVRPGDIDLKPAISDDRWWQKINGSPAGLPTALRDALKVQRIRDTGWRLHRRYRDDPGARIELLIPHYVPPESARYRWERRLSPVLPKSWLMFPAREESFVRESFLKARFPEAYARGWEEFTWRGAPFAVHLRGVGRAMSGADTAG